MAFKVCFKLKEPQKGVLPGAQRETSINMFFSYGFYIVEKGKRKYTPLKFATGEMVKPCNWKDRPVYRVKQIKDIDYLRINAVLDNIEGAVKKIYREQKAVNCLPDPDRLRQLLKIELNLIPTSIIKKENLNEYIERFVNEIKEGKRLANVKNKQQRFKPGTIRNYTSFKNIFHEYQKARSRRIDFEDINRDFYQDFTNYFLMKNQTPNQIGKMIKFLKIFLNAANKDGCYSGTEHNSFKVQRDEVDNIYLNESEILKLEKLNLSYDEDLCKIRDVFLIGVYTAQRYSDYSRIRKEHIRTTNFGTKVMDLVQRKTGERVVIPITSKLDSLLKKYDYNSPRIADQKINEQIKGIARKAGITDMVPVKKIQGGLEIEKDYAKCTLIRTHTARRSGATNMYLAGIPTLDIMKLTGHKTEKEFLKYINVGKEETADKLAQREYFNKHLKIAR